MESHSPVGQTSGVEIVEQKTAVFYKLSFFFFFNKFVHLFIYFWLRWVFVAAWAFSSCGERGLLFVAVRGLLIVVASLAAEHGL